MGMQHAASKICGSWFPNLFRKKETKMTLSNMTLVKIAAVGGVITSTMGILFRGKIESNIKATDFYKEALQTLKNHPEAMQVLGEPIIECGINIGDQKRNFAKENIARYEVPIKGSKRRGTLCFRAEREGIENSWVVKHVELELDHSKIRKIIIKPDLSK